MSNIHNESGSIEDRIEVLVPLCEIGGPHRPQVNVSKLTVTLLFDPSPASVLPISISQTRLAGRWFHNHVPWLCITPTDRQEHLLTLLLSQQQMRVQDREHTLSIDMSNDVTLGNIEVGISEGRKLIGIIGIGLVNVGNPVSFDRQVLFESCTQGRNRNVVLTHSTVSSPNRGVQC